MLVFGLGATYRPTDKSNRPLRLYSEPLLTSRSVPFFALSPSARLANPYHAVLRQLFKLDKHSLTDRRVSMSIELDKFLAERHSDSSGGIVLACAASRRHAGDLSSDGAMLNRHPGICGKGCGQRKLVAASSHATSIKAGSARSTIASDAVRLIRK